MSQNRLIALRQVVKGLCGTQQRPLLGSVDVSGSTRPCTHVHTRAHSDRPTDQQERIGTGNRSTLLMQDGTGDARLRSGRCRRRIIKTDACLVLVPSSWSNKSPQHVI